MPPWKSSLSFSLDNLLPTRAKMTKINKGHCEEEIEKGKNNTNSKLKLILVNTTTLKKGY